MFGMMIWGVDFEQDLKPLIKAFYPGCDFTVKKGEIQGNLRDMAEWTAFLEREFPKNGFPQNGCGGGAEEAFFPDYVFYLMASDGYFAVRHGGEWVPGEFHVGGQEAGGKIQTGGADLQEMQAKTQTDGADLQEMQARTQTGSADLQEMQSRTQTGSADLQKVQTKTQTDGVDLQELQSGIQKEEDAAYKKEFQKQSRRNDRENAARHREYRNSLMRPLYRVLEQVSGVHLPWGILTGIRPTKQVLEQLEAGKTEAEIARFMREEYFCSDEKIATSLAVAKTECEILKGMDYRAGYSMYIGIPFCPSTCYYCSFPSYPLAIHGARVEEYLEALFKEIRYAGGEGAIPGKQLQTIYVGGGTPTTLSAKQLDRLFACMEDNLDMSHVQEITVEAGRPDSITREKLSVIRAHGIRRISINPQSMKQKTLDLIGRRHTVEEICEAFSMARELGFDNINMDLILGLAGETPKDVAETLSHIGKLSPDNLTVHTLAVKRAARLNTNREEYAGLAASGVQEMLRLSREFAAANDYYPYYLYRQKNMTENLENVGYARRGKEGLYNILIMEERQSILALGAGATTKYVMPAENRMERVENVKSLKDYIERIDEMIGRKEKFLLAHRDKL